MDNNNNILFTFNFWFTILFALGLGQLIFFHSFTFFIGIYLVGFVIAFCIMIFTLKHKEIWEFFSNWETFEMLNLSKKWQERFTTLLLICLTFGWFLYPLMDIIGSLFDLEKLMKKVDEKIDYTKINK